MVVEAIGIGELIYQRSVLLEVTVCALAHIGHKRTAERIRVISRFMALLSINVVGNSYILPLDIKVVIDSVGGIYLPWLIKPQELFFCGLIHPITEVILRFTFLPF
jgi:hypothetical protein